jgi:NADH-quinone oxidoreductase subunit L
LLILWSWFVGFLSPAVGQGSIPEPEEFSEGMSPHLLLSLMVAVSGVIVGYLSFTKFSGSWWPQSAMGKRWYVHFLNKLYFDEVYETYVVQPTLRLAQWLWRVVDRQGFDALIMGIANVSVVTAKWLWRVVDLRGIDGLVVGLGRNSIGMAGWLWRVVDLHGIDRVVVGLGQRSVGLAKWLWRVVDLRGVDRVVVGIGKQSIGIANWLWNLIEIKVLDKNVNRLADQTEATGDLMREMEPRTLQHHLLVMIFWLIVGMGLLFWFVV